MKLCGWITHAFSQCCANVLGKLAQGMVDAKCLIIHQTCLNLLCTNRPYKIELLRFTSCYYIGFQKSNWFNLRERRSWLPRGGLARKHVAVMMKRDWLTLRWRNYTNCTLRFLHGWVFETTCVLYTATFSVGTDVFFLLFLQEHVYRVADPARYFVVCIFSCKQLPLTASLCKIPHLVSCPWSRTLKLPCEAHNEGSERPAPLKLRFTTIYITHTVRALRQQLRCE